MAAPGPLSIVAARALPRSKRIAFALAALLYPIPGVAMALLHPGIAWSRVLLDGGVIGAMLGGLAFVAAWALSREREVEAPLQMNGDVLEHGGVAIATRGTIEEGNAWEASDGAHVQLGKRVRLRMSRIEDARAVLTAMGVDASKKAARYSILSTSGTNGRVRFGLALASLPLSIALAIVLQKMTGVPTPAFVFLLPYLLAATAAMIPGRIRVGTDGVLLRWLWQQRFVPLADIETVTMTEGSLIGRVRLGLRLGLRGGEMIEIDVTAPTRTTAAIELGRASVQTIIERIEEARVVARGEGALDATLVLARAGRSGADWLAGLRAAFADVEGFRNGPPLTLEQLWRAVEDPDVRPWMRAAAAAALVTIAPAERSARLRIAADATVAPKLRVALDAAADGDDDKLAEALESIEHDEPQEERRA
jgi:hypothetical protein